MGDFRRSGTGFLSSVDLEDFTFIFSFFLVLSVFSQSLYPSCRVHPGHLTFVWLHSSVNRFGKLWGYIIVCIINIFWVIFVRDGEYLTFILWQQWEPGWVCSELRCWSGFLWFLWNYLGFGIEVEWTLFRSLFWGAVSLPRIFGRFSGHLVRNSHIKFAFLFRKLKKKKSVHSISFISFRRI